MCDSGVVKRVCRVVGMRGGGPGISERERELARRGVYEAEGRDAGRWSEGVESEGGERRAGHRAAITRGIGVEDGIGGFALNWAVRD